MNFILYSTHTDKLRLLNSYTLSARLYGLVFRTVWLPEFNTSHIRVKVGIAYFQTRCASNKMLVWHQADDNENAPYKLNHIDFQTHFAYWLLFYMVAFKDQSSKLMRVQR